MTRVFGTAKVAQGNRSFRRLALGVPAVLVLPHGHQPCTLDDVSASGARVSSDVLLRKDSVVEVRFDRHRLFGTVSWVRGARAGIRFDRPLDMTEMRRLLWVHENREAWEAQRETIGARSWSSGADTHKV
jgi:hypothetical protein